MENKIENDQGLNDDNKRMSTYVNGKKQDGKKKNLTQRVVSAMNLSRNRRNN